MTNDFDDEYPAPIDVLLREHAGGASPPDLTARVAAGVAAGGAARAAARLRWQRGTAPSPMPRRLAIAAVVVLGAGVVGATRWLASDGAAGTREQQAPQPAPAPMQDPQRPEQEPAGELRFELRVVDPHGGPVQAFALDVYQVLATEPVLRLTRVGVATRSVAPRDFAGDHAVIGGLPAGTFVAVVSADLHARTVSSPFTLAADAAVPRAVVTLQSGAELQGVVLGRDGKPLAGALVRTLAPGAALHPALAEAMRNVAPRLLDERSVRTEADGTWRLRHLAGGTYRVHVGHPDHCEGVVERVTVGGGTRRLGTIALAGGARVSGRALGRGGRPHANAIVTVQRMDDPGEPDAQPRLWQTTSADDGVFALPHRLPVGRYRITAQVPPKQGGNPFALMQDVQRLQREFDVARDSGVVTEDVEVAGG
jgi:hypothetical protein